ncbi:unnamed protein product [Ambrosiozyma monospora]|uniref:Unnamed protein product n=1 Tax=Ambrosiozyma monospora TaxID=43982 RepID=A0A9W7DH03_AMBMO|nr:unnamed protein product [Ambrosiozyma monospora]
MQSLFSKRPPAKDSAFPSQKQNQTTKHKPSSSLTPPHLVTSNLPPSFQQNPSQQQQLQQQQQHQQQQMLQSQPLQQAQVQPVQQQQHSCSPFHFQVQQGPMQQQQYPPNNPTLPPLTIPQNQAPQINFTGATPSTYSFPQLQMQPAAPTFSKRRVWVKKPKKTPTTLMVGPNDIVDDLKSLVLMKYPTSLALQVDPSDLVVKLEVQFPQSVSPAGASLTTGTTIFNSPKTIDKYGLSDTSALAQSNSIAMPMAQSGSYKRTTPVASVPKPMAKVPKAKQSTSHPESTTLSYLKSSAAPVSPVPISASKSSLLPKHHGLDQPSSKLSKTNSNLSNLSTGKGGAPYFITLEPDVLVYQILDQYFPHGMKMQDSFIVEPCSPVVPPPARSTTTQIAPIARTSTAPPMHQYNTIAEVEAAGGRITPQTLQPAVNLKVRTPHELTFPINIKDDFKSAIMGGTSGVAGGAPGPIERSLPSPREAKFKRAGSVTVDATPSSTVILFPKSKKPESKSPTPQNSQNITNTPSYHRKVASGDSIVNPLQRVDEYIKSQSNDKMLVLSGSNNSKNINTTNTNKSNAGATTSGTAVTNNNKNEATEGSPNSTANRQRAGSTNMRSNPMTIHYKKKPMKLSKQPQVGLSKILSHVNVLVVEDNLVNQKIMARHLKSCNVMYKIASTGKEALEMWKEGGFQLCFMDIQLPVMSGIEVTQEIRRLERLNHIGNFAQSSTTFLDEISKIDPADHLNLEFFRSPIIIVALTASTSAEDKQDALAAGCNDYLTKPVQLKWLKNKLTEWGCMQALINYERFRNYQ